MKGAELTFPNQRETVLKRAGACLAWGFSATILHLMGLREVTRDRSALLPSLTVVRPEGFRPEGWAELFTGQGRFRSRDKVGWGPYGEQLSGRLKEEYRASELSGNFGSIKGQNAMLADARIDASKLHSWVGGGGERSKFYRHEPTFEQGCRMLQKERNAAFLLLYVFTTGTVSAAVLAGPIENPSNGHPYFLLTEGAGTRAEQEAVNLGRHLVTIKDRATFGNYGGVRRVFRSD